VRSGKETVYLRCKFVHFIVITVIIIIIIIIIIINREVTANKPDVIMKN